MLTLYIQYPKKVLQATQLVLAAILFISVGYYHKSNNYSVLESKGGRIVIKNELLTSNLLSTSDRRNSIPLQNEVPPTSNDCEEREFEDDKNEKDNSPPLNPDHNKLHKDSNAIGLTSHSSKTGSSLPIPLYVLHHSWKHFLS